jgi:hypothetical protein
VRDATTDLAQMCAKLSIREYARLGLRRARLNPDSGDSYRRPPEGWEKAIAKLAEARAAELAKLAAELREAGE